MFHDLESGAEFYFSEDDYVTQVDNDMFNCSEQKVKVKLEAALETISSTPPIRASPTLKPTASRGKKRPRRMAATSVRSYIVPDSDDEAIVNDSDSGRRSGQARKKKVESNLQQWIKHLSVLLKEEQKKVDVQLFEAFNTANNLSLSIRRRRNAQRDLVYQIQNLVC
jgi:hypothetical protein